MQDKIDREREIQREMAEKQEAEREEQRRIRNDIEAQKDIVVEAKRAVEGELAQRMVRDYRFNRSLARN
jgi:hypothetical protein